MYRPASGISGSKWHGVHAKVYGAAVRFTSSNVPGIMSSGLTNPLSNELRTEAVNPLLPSGPLEARIETLRDGGNFSSESGASLPPSVIDLELRGYSILRQGSSVPNYWNRHASNTQDLGHGVLTYGGSARMSERKNSISQRGFSSHEEKIPVIRHLTFCDEYDLKNGQLVSLRKCLSENSIVTPISPAGLFREIDFKRYGRLELGDLGLPILRQLSGLATVNLMRGLNISELILLDNILWSPLYQCIVLDKTSLSTDSKVSECPYNAVRKVFKECLEISIGDEAGKVTLPYAVSRYLLRLQGAKTVDKRIITNHSATKYPGEHMQRNSRLNQLLRQEPPRHILDVTEDESLQQISQRATIVLTDLASEFPFELLMSCGVHPVIDYWAREGQRRRGIKSGKSPIVLPKSPFENLRTGSSTDRDMILAALIEDLVSVIELGRILVALHRDPFEHLYEAFNKNVWRKSYNVLDVQKLLNGVNPMFGITSELSIITRGIWDLWEVDPGSKPLYCYWTNVRWGPTGSRASSRK